MSERVSNLFEGLIGFIHDLQTSLEQTGTVNAAHLDEKWGWLNAQLNSLPLNERLEYAPELADLQKALGDFEQELRAQKEHIRGQLGGMNTHHQASRAYRISDTRDGGAKDGDY